MKNKNNLLIAGISIVGAVSGVIAVNFGVITGIIVSVCIGIIFALSFGVINRRGR